MVCPGGKIVRPLDPSSSVTGASRRPKRKNKISDGWEKSGSNFLFNPVHELFRSFHTSGSSPVVLF